MGSTTSGSIVWEASPLSGTGANDARTVLINAFEKAYPNIKVTLVSAPTDTDTYRATRGHPDLRRRVQPRRVHG